MKAGGTMQEVIKIKRLFTTATLLSLVILAAYYFLLHWFSTLNEGTAAVINLSGRQRMYSQRAALWAERLVDAETTTDQNFARNTLRQIKGQIEETHSSLLNPNSTYGTIAHNSTALRKIYFAAPLFLDSQQKSFIAHIDNLLLAEGNKLNDNNPDLRFLITNGSNQLLLALDQAVTEYQKINSDNVRILYFSSLGLIIVGVGTLIGLWVFVFHPMLKNVNKTVQLLNLQQRVATAANTAETIEEGLQVAIDGVCEYMQWPVGHAFIYSEEKDALVSVDTWHLSIPRKYDVFKRTSESATFRKGEGFIGEVLSDATPMWILDVAHSSVFQRKGAAQEAELKSAFCFPIFVGRKAVGVLEFYSSVSHIPSEELLKVMANIGRQLGQTIERSQSFERSKLLETVIQSANDAIIITTANLNEPGPEITYVNDAFTRISGYNPEEVIGKSPRFLQNEFTKRETLDALRQALREGKPFKDELLNVSKGGEHYWLDISIVPVRNAQGTITHFAAIEHDITSSKKQEIERNNMWVQLNFANLKAEKAAKELQESLQKAVEANKAKSDFLANMSHELRTPMNGVLGMAHLLADTSLNEEQKEFVSTINGSAENLLLLLNDILDFSKIEAGALMLENIAFELTECIHQTLTLLRPQSDKKSIQLIEHCDTKVPTYIWGDSGRLRQIIINLVGNAIKFTEKGYVRLHAQLLMDDDGQKLMLRIEDTGIGIPKEKLHEIFEKFTQGDASVTRKFGGTGLGLAITKQLVHLMGGEIGVDSMEGVGSTFWCSIPCRPATAEDTHAHIDEKQCFSENPTTQRIPIATANALLVEDYHVNRVFAEKLLYKFGFRNIDWAENGLEAVEKFNTRQYDVIFMDCQMPGMDGYQTTQTLRAQEEHSGQHTPVIAMTANAMVGDREKCLKAGMDAYLSKPLRADHLKKILEEWFTMEEKNAQTSLPPKPQNEAPTAPIDLEQLRLFTDGDLQEEFALAQLFLEQATEIMDVLKSNVAAEQSTAWKASAHRFKGSAGNMGATLLHMLCKHAENNYQDSEKDKSSLLTSMEQEISRIRLFMSQQTGSPL